MRLINNVVIVLLFSFSGTTVADPYWENEHAHSYDHHYDTHHHYESDYVYDEYQTPIDNRWYSESNSTNNSLYYSRGVNRANAVRSDRTPQYNRSNESGHTDFYYFKQDEQPVIQQTSISKKGHTGNHLPLSSLDLEDKLKSNSSKPVLLKVKSSKPIKTKSSKPAIPTMNSSKPKVPKLTTNNIKQAKASLALTLPQCQRKLRRHNIRFSSMPPTWGIKYPVKIHSTIGGVRYRHSSNRSSFSIMDCRLAAALIGWSKILKKYSIYEVVHMRIYSPGATVKNTSKPSGHSWGLAIDVAKFKSRQYGELNVKYDWSDQRPKVSPCIKSSKSAQPLKLLRAIVCNTANKQLFAMILTPHYNRAHHDHLHIELRPRLRKLVLR